MHYITLRYFTLQSKMKTHYNPNTEGSNESKSNRKLTNQNQRKQILIQYETLHYNIQYNLTNTIIQIEKKQMKLKARQQKSNEIKYNTV